MAAPVLAWAIVGVVLQLLPSMLAADVPCVWTPQQQNDPQPPASSGADIHMDNGNLLIDPPANGDVLVHGVKVKALEAKYNKVRE